MERHTLGSSGLETAPLILGGNVFGWTVKEKTAFQLLDAFVDAGFNCIDTADIYPLNHPGASEFVIGKWLRKSGKRDRVIIATKVGIDLAVERPAGTAAGSRNHLLQRMKVRLTKEKILQGVDESLKRLKTDYIDLYQAHRDDNSTPLDETLHAFDQLIKAGKVRAIGSSNYAARRLAEAISVAARKGYCRYETLQPCYNLYARNEFEQELQGYCLDEDIGVIPYLSLGSGFLTGKYRTPDDLQDKPRAYRVKDMLNERGMRILEALDAVADETGASQAQAALAWLMAQASVVAPIASATCLGQLEELIGATKLQLGSEHMQILNRAGDETDQNSA